MKTPFNEMIVKLKNISTGQFPQFLKDNNWTYEEFNPEYAAYVKERDKAERDAWVKKEEEKLKVKEVKRKTKQ